MRAGTTKIGGRLRDFQKNIAAQQRVDQHRGVDGDAIGGGEVGGGFEHQNQEDDADQEEPVDLGDIDLALTRSRSCG